MVFCKKKPIPIRAILIKQLIQFQIIPGYPRHSENIKREAEGVVVDLYPLDDEMSASLAGCSITFAEAEPQANSK
jgi:hypothetical protein